jgi:ABC-type uncharacterized transport system fused permease/ATPase subunit
MEMSDDEFPPKDEGATKRTFQLYAIVCMAFIVVGYIAALFAIFLNDRSLPELVHAKMTLVVGLPLAALTAFSLVVILESQSGSIEVKAFGFEFRGASGPIVMWVLCFLSLVTAIKVLS